mmetsp:Transcript_35005/g.88194  ORF Transcript_35005/g.88194 Transcript_35005/m.88194 type:complete len:220 (-) Transcript_35005:1072-1731(-)
MLTGEVGKVVCADLRQEILRLEHDVADEAPRSDAVANPEATATTALDVWDPVLRATQAAKLLPALQPQVEHPRGKNVQVETVSVVTGNDVRVELVDLRQQRVQQRHLRGVVLHAVLPEHALRVTGQRRRVNASDGRPLLHAVPEVTIGLGGVRVQLRVERARDRHRLVGLLRAALQGLHGDAQHAQRRAGGRHAHRSELAALVVGLGDGHRGRRDAELD